MTTVGNSTQLNDLLSKLGVSQSFVNEQAALLSQSSVGILLHLQAGYTEADVGSTPGANRFRRMMSEKDRRLPPFGWNRPPAQMLSIMAPICGEGCAAPSGSAASIDGSGSTAFERLFHPRRRAGAKLERFLTNHPHARAAFEAQIGGTVVSFGRRDGRMAVQRNNVGFTPVTANAAPVPATTALGIFAQMEQAVLDQARHLAAISHQQGGGAPVSGAYGFGQFVSGGLSNAAGLNGFGVFSSGLGGAGSGSWNPNALPGNINNTNPLYERAHQAEVDGVLNDPSLTVEDKVTLMIMMVMNKSDDDIQRQGQYINSIQQQQSNRNGGKPATPAKVGSLTGGSLGGPAVAGFGMFGGNGGSFGTQVGGPPTNTPSIDVETMKLKRMIDKRSQMFDMLRSIIDKYNETAKNIIQSIGR